MEKEKNYEFLNQPDEIAVVITIAIVDYCVKSNSIDENINPS